MAFNTEYHLNNGLAHIINTGEKTLTTQAEHAMLYIKNTGSESVLVDNSYFGSTGATSGLISIKVYACPTGGTIITDEDDSLNITNKLIGNSTALDCDVYVGGQGKTLTGGNLMTIMYRPATSPSKTFGGVIIPAGECIGITMEPLMSSPNHTMYHTITLHTDG